MRASVRAGSGSGRRSLSFSQRRMGGYRPRFSTTYSIA